VLVLCNR